MRVHRDNNAQDDKETHGDVTKHFNGWIKGWMGKKLVKGWKLKLVQLDSSRYGEQAQSIISEFEKRIADLRLSHASDVFHFVQVLFGITLSPNRITVPPG